MKIAAVLIPLAIFLLPTIIQVVMALRYGAKGKDLFKSSLLMTASNRKKLLAFICVYWCAFAVSLSWSAYVFSSNTWLSVSIGLVWALIFLIPMLIAVLKASKKPVPPTENFPEPKTGLEFENRAVDLLSARMNKANKIFGWFMVGWVAIVIVLVIILTIIALTVGLD